MATVRRARVGLAVGMTLLAVGVSVGRGSETGQLAEPFKGITTNGTPVRGLFPIRATGVSTAAARAAATSFIGSLTAEQKAETMFTADHEE